MKAIILCAGQGKRLLPLTAQRPKCLLPIGGLTILEWQIKSLAVNGVDEIVIVTGFGADAVEEAVRRLATDRLKVRVLYNPFYTVADNIGSCYVAHHEMTGDFLLLNGDTLFEPAIVERLLASATMPATVTIDRKARYDADDMKVHCAGNALKSIGKTLPLKIVDGESIGLLLFKGEGGSAFVRQLGEALRDPQALSRWYLSVVDSLAKTGIVGVASIEGLQWAEVDFPADVRRAEQMTLSWWTAGSDHSAAGESA